jgi:uncharacterized protein YndB with AHSA1/START domain
MTNPTKAERTSDRELTVTRTVGAPVRIVFKAWSTPELFQQWWVPKSFPVTMLSCQMDIRTGGTYRIEMGHPAHAQPMAFFGRYLEVVPNARIVWTNEESGEGGAVTTVTFAEKDGQTLVTMRDLYPSKQALDDAIASGATSGTPEQFAQMEAFAAAMVAG